LMPLGEWLTVARRGTGLPAQEAGVIRSSDAQSRNMQELQLRVDLAP
jgi:hypothetical protein